MGAMIGWGIIGVGDVTEVKANASIFNTRDSRLVHVMRRTGEKARDYAERHGVPKWTADAETLLSDPEVNVVFIATPSATHAELTIAALRAGKDVLIEKPMAMDSIEAALMVDTAVEAGRRLWVAYYRRALPRYVRIADLITAGAIGRVLGVQLSWRKAELFEGWRWDPAHNRGGEFAETVCHAFDLLDHLLGPATRAAGDVTSDLRQVAASWRQGEVPASGTWAFGAAEDAEWCELIGELGTMRFAFFNGSNTIEITRPDGVERIEVDDPPHVHGPLVASIIAEMHGRGQCPSTGASALRTARTIDAILG